MKTKEIKSKIQDTLGASGEKVASNVVSELAEKVIKARTEVLMRGLSVIEKLEFQKTKADVPDAISYSKEGEKIENFTPKRHQLRIDIQKAIDTVTEACDKAIAENNDEAYKFAAKVISENERTHHSNRDEMEYYDDNTERY